MTLHKFIKRLITVAVRASCSFGCCSVCFALSSDELSLTGITRCSAAKAIRDVLGGSVEHIGGSYDKYKIYDEDGRAWSIVSDASIEPYKKNGDRASDLYKVEMNSPVLDYEDIPLLQSVIRGLRSAGAITGPQYDCGTHVHIDASDFDAQKIRNLVNIWSSKEDFLWDALQVSSVWLFISASCS